MADLDIPVPIVEPNEPVNPRSFRELFQHMPDVYDGHYEGYLEAFGVNNTTAADVITNVALRFPFDQVPGVFVYLGTDRLIRTIHHIHVVDRPFGQPRGPWDDVFLGFIGDITYGQINTVLIPQADLFSITPLTIVPSIATMTAMLTEAPANGIIIPNNVDETYEEIASRKSVPVPHAYIPLLFNRTLTPREAWNQVGAQIIMDGRQEDCLLLLNFLRMVNIQGPAERRSGPLTDPVIMLDENFQPPLADEALHHHIHRKLRSYLPGLTADTGIGQVGQQFLQGAELIRQTVLQGNEARRIDRQQEVEAATAPTTFSSLYPANAAQIRRLCGAGNDDDHLPDYWRILAASGGKKKAAFPALITLVMTRANDLTSSGVNSVVSAYLFEQILNFQLGSADVDDITKGVNPFLMCPIGHVAAKGLQELNLQYTMVSSDGAIATLTDVRSLTPSNYRLPGSVYQMVEFIGALSVVIDVLLGVENPLSEALRNHYFFWRHEAPMVNNSLTDTSALPSVMIGTLRAIQLTTIRYINDQMHTLGDMAPPDFKYIETIINQRSYHTLPHLPAFYFHAPTPSVPPPVQAVPTPPPPAVPAATPTPRTAGAPIAGKNDELNQTWIYSFKASPKSIQDLRALPASRLPKAADGKCNICLSFHLRGSCFDNCRNKATHRRLNAAEREAVQQLVSTEL